MMASSVRNVSYTLPLVTHLEVLHKVVERQIVGLDAGELDVLVRTVLSGALHTERHCCGTPGRIETTIVGPVLADHLAGAAVGPRRAAQSADLAPVMVDVLWHGARADSGGQLQLARRPRNARSRLPP